MSLWYLDYETKSAVDIKSLGAYRYAADPSTRILLCALAKDDDPPLLWDHRQPNDSAFLDILEEMLADDGLIIAHNAQFEQAITQFLFETTFDFPPPAPERWRCSAAMCRRASIPFSLKEAAVFLNLPVQKMETGRNSIKYFCTPNPKRPKDFDESAEWQLFREYCVQDVVVERLLYKTLFKWFHLDNHPLVLDSFLLDARINQRGIPVNLDALQKAWAIVQEFEGDSTAEFQALTGLRPGQVNQVLQWVQAEGFPFDNLQAQTIETALEDHEMDISTRGLKALELRAGGAFASLKKIPVMQKAACPDGTVKGTFLWWGATTGRWSGRVIQSQNFKRPTIKDTHIAYDWIKRGEDLSVIYDQVPEVVSSCIRHFIEGDGPFLGGDFASIEAKCAPWVCGQQDMLDEFIRGEDVYVNMAAEVFSIPKSSVGSLQRFVGKQVTLAAQFGVGWKKFRNMCKKFGRELEDEVCQLAVKKYREKRDKIVATWREFNDAAMDAIRSPATTIEAGKVKFVAGKVATGLAALQIILPSGRRLTYPSPRIRSARRREIDGEWVRLKPSEPWQEGDWENQEVQFWGKSKGSVLWGYQSTWGAKFLENCVQAIAGDFLVLACLEMERRGIKPFMVVHDEVLAHKEDHTIESFHDCMTIRPPWALDFPLEAECKVVPYYQKD